MCPLHQLGYLSFCPSKFTSYGLFRIYWWITPHLLRCLLWYLTIFNTFHQAGTSFRFHLHGWSNLEFTRHLPWYTQWSVLGRLWANNGAQTRNPQLGRLVLYLLSYIRKCSRYGIRNRVTRMKILYPGPLDEPTPLKRTLQEFATSHSCLIVCLSNFTPFYVSKSSAYQNLQLHLISNSPLSMSSFETQQFTFHYPVQLYKERLCLPLFNYRLVVAYGNFFRLQGVMQGRRKFWIISSGTIF